MEEKKVSSWKNGVRFALASLLILAGVFYFSYFHNLMTYIGFENMPLLSYISPVTQIICYYVFGILAFIMIENWLQRQITSIENTRMKYSGSDFKMTSQANHLAKLIALKTECRRQTHHFQRLYKRREKNPDTGIYRSTWYKFGENSAIQ